METITKRHPIRGFLYGILLGLGLMLLVVGQGIAALGTYPPFIVLIVGIVLGTLWGTYGPAKAPKGPPPAGATVVDDAPAPEPEPAAVAATMADEADAPEAETEAGGDEPET